ncbi:MAG: diguanylate cyclase [Anaerolineales bacterium]|nr:diguanylate cyclase [Anaerolineales bacterium]
MNKVNSQDEKIIGRALIADDDADFRSLLVRRANKMGLSVVEVENGDLAMEEVRKQSFDLLIVDLYMPGRTGLEVVKDALRLDRDLEAIILTGSASLETAIEALRTGVYDYLTKPLESMTVFEMTVTRALERRHLIRENERLFKEVQRLAITDQLTGLFNRHKLKDGLESEVERARRYGRPLSLIMLDLDNMKGINDTYGHAVGDIVLQLVAKAIRDHIRRVDMPARIGGDEFLVVLPEAEMDVASEVAKRVCNQIFTTSYKDIEISISVGVGQWNTEYVSPQGFLHAVDQALYQAKRAGGKRIYACRPNGSAVPQLEDAKQET